MAGKLILTLRDDGRWCKYIAGKMRYFGRGTYEQALEEYYRVRDDLEAGRTPRPQHQNLTVRDVVNLFLNAKRQQMDRGKLSPRTWTEYRRAGNLLTDTSGTLRLADDLHQGDFAKMLEKIEETCGDHARARYIRSTKTLIRWAQESGYIEGSVRFGPSFKPDVSSSDRTPRLFTPEQCRALVRRSRGPLRAMILLGLNGGFGQTDCAELRMGHLHLDAGMIDFKRPKTGIPRKVALWSVTVRALRRAIEERPDPADPEDADRVFLTQRGRPWVRTKIKRTGSKVERVAVSDSVGAEFAKHLERVGIKVIERKDKQDKGRVVEGKGLGFYTLRHTFRTFADDAKDHHSIATLMGHRLPGMSGVYVEEVSTKRLRAVVKVVHRRVWGRSPRQT